MITDCSWTRYDTDTGKHDIVVDWLVVYVPTRKRKREVVEIREKKKHGSIFYKKEWTRVNNGRKGRPVAPSPSPAPYPSIGMPTSLLHTEYTTNYTGAPREHC